MRAPLFISERDVANRSDTLQLEYGARDREFPIRRNREHGEIFRRLIAAGLTTDGMTVPEAPFNVAMFEAALVALEDELVEPQTSAPP